MAIAYPQAKTCHAEGLEVDVIAGFRSKDIVILEDEFKSACDHLYIMTDDGSYGEQGFVTVKLKELIDSGIHYDAVIAIGPIQEGWFFWFLFGDRISPAASRPSSA